MLNAHYSMYHSNDLSISNSIFDCLYAHLTDYDEYLDYSSIPIHQLIPYCRRLDVNGEKGNVLNISLNNINNIITFNNLHKYNVTSTQLLNWFASIDIAEQYEMEDNNSMNIFYNCSLPWFGSKCQYSFDYESSLSFDNIVRSIFFTRRKFKSSLDPNIGTCYSFLVNCYRDSLFMCLDWREICDGKFDCDNGDDEQYCQVLETSECPHDTYRCHYGGQCIPLDFIMDGPASSDCLDGTDEMELYEKEFYNSENTCFKLPTFRCEEYTSRHLHSFSCGDGQYYLIDFHHFYRFECSNGIHMRAAALSIVKMSQSFNYLEGAHIEQIWNSALESNLVFLKTILINSTTSHTLIPCESTNKNCISKWIFKVQIPYIYIPIHFIYLPNRLISEFFLLSKPDFICFHQKQCPTFINCAVDIGLNNGLICCRTSEILNRSLAFGTNVYKTLNDLYIYCSTTGIDQSCSHPSLFHCPLSLKCISIHRLVDGITDCYFGEDESFPACQLNDSKRFTCKSEENKCLSPIALYNGKFDCIGKEDEMNETERNILQGYISFGFLCDGKNHLLLLESNETDETNCEYWPCNNPYTRCNTFRNCYNGIDELNCPKIQCQLKETFCSKTLSTNRFCLPLMNLMEKYLDCEIFDTEHEMFFENGTSNNTGRCIYSDTQCTSLGEVCRGPAIKPILLSICIVPNEAYCHYQRLYLLANIHDNICPFLPKTSLIDGLEKSFFIPSQLDYFPTISVKLSNKNNSKFNQQTLTPPKFTSGENWYCNRGILIRFNINQTNKCLCPPSYFGNRCQWQNQRISLTLQLVHRTDTYTIAVFQVIIMLIDEEKQISSYHEQITYVPKRDCGTKFNIYLLYPDKPKNLSTNYSIHIDIFDKRNLTYISSWHLSIPFQFLPVNRIATQLFIPSTSLISKSCPLYCGEHGRCVEYINKNFSYFCQCDQGYFGLQCNIKYNCSCSSDSHCLTPSICICPMNKFGSKCYLKHSICQILNNSCQNDGICLPIDDRKGLNQFTCLCHESFYGTKCENTKNQIDIKFDDNSISAMPFVYVHLITAFENDDHQRMTRLKKINIEQNLIKIFTINSFHIVFIGLTNQTYYLVVLREKFIESEYIQTKLLSNYRCLSINELMNITFLNYTFLRRVKYYPLLCQQNKQLMCFYDDKYMCICDRNRFSNCFTFNHTISYDCQGKNICENEGSCFQDDSKCPTQSICVCPDCYYGTKCQFTTRGFVISLDYILSYHIKPYISFNKQSFIIKMSIAITTIMLSFGLINGFLSIKIFHQKKIKSVGCGLYLLISSWNSSILIIILIIKFWQLILIQMSIINNRLFFTINCILLDFILKVLIASNDWLYGCVAVERMFTAVKGVKFNQVKSRKMAKWITLTIFLLTILTHIHDPIHRRLVDDVDIDEKRTWCLAQYSSAVNIFNMFITLFHFLIPFSINIISTTLIIIPIARSRFKAQPGTPLKEHLRRQFHQHKHNLFASCALVILALPRLIISFITGCMKSPRDSWLFLFGYLIPFIPSMMTIIVFIIPAKIYKDEFDKVIQRIMQRIRNRFNSSNY